MNYLARRVIVQSFVAPRTSLRNTFRGLAVEPVSRNRGGRTLPADASPGEAHPYVFRDELRKIIQKIETSVQDMIPLNEDFSVSRPSEEELVVQTKRGKFSFKPDHDKMIIIMQSYITGYHNYYFEPSERLWLSTKDNHDMRGLFIRDIMRHSNGCPKLD
ncbi:hypothetical protein EON64_01275 [archaeon]|nr:MAG: hypothetical protein EON64_01275 [archaeon]